MYVVIKRIVLLLVLAFPHIATASAPPAMSEPPPDAITITMAEFGDHHGTMVPRPNLRRGDVAKRSEAGLARLAHIVKEIRKEDPDALIFNAGDTIQGSAEVLYSKGQAIVDVLDTFGIDAYAPGNWDWLYGKDRMVELFGDGRWGVVAANAYDAETGEQIFPGHRILEVKGVKIGIIGLTAERGLPGVPTANIGLKFTDGKAEVAQAIKELEAENVDLIILVSEMGLAKNTLLVDEIPGIDAVFSSDMHEETPEVVITPGGVFAAEIGWGGSRVAKLELFLVPDDSGEDRYRIAGHRYEWISTEGQPEDPETAELVAKARAPFIEASAFETRINPLSGHALKTPIDTVVGRADKGLFRGSFANGIEPPATPPGVLEGTSHAFIADAFRHQTGTDIGMIRGFRYGGYVREGDITLGDLYTFLNAGAQLATGTVTGAQVQDAVERTIDGSLRSDPFGWGGGWLHGFSNVSYEIDLTQPFGKRAQDLTIGGKPVDPEATYTISGYYFETEPDRIGAFHEASDVKVLTHPDGSVKDPTEFVAEYLSSISANPKTGRVRLQGEFPPPVFGNPEIQPLRGAIPQ
ncbi:bifunctional metallophosphatase/5'-nucleotidase [Halochromatium sp.]